MRGAWTPRYATSDTPQTTARAATTAPHRPPDLACLLISTHDSRLYLLTRRLLLLQRPT